MTEEIERYGGGGDALIPAQQQTNNTAVAASMSRAEVTVQMQHTAARRFPRNMQQFRVKMLDACKRPGWAEMARYKRPVSGNKNAEGFSIRFAEEVIRNYGNLETGSEKIDETAESRTFQAVVYDYETNSVIRSSPYVVSKYVERKQVKPGQKVFGERMNSYGDKVYLVEATEAEMHTVQQAQLSKATREVVMRLLPSDIAEECLRTIVATLRGEIKADPKAAIRKLVDAFNDIGVQPKDLEGRLGHSLDSISPLEIEELRSVFSAIKNGEAAWKDFLDGELKPAPKDSAPPVGRASVKKGDKKEPTEVKAEPISQAETDKINPFDAAE